MRFRPRCRREERRAVPCHRMQWGAALPIERRHLHKGGHMPITSIVEFPPVEDHYPREGYHRVTRQLNDWRPITRRSEFGEGLLAHVHSIAEDGGVVVVEVWQD